MELVLKQQITLIKQKIAGYDPWELAAKLTLLTLLLSPVGNWFIRPLILSLSVAGLLIPGMWRAPSLWTALTLLSGIRFYIDWPRSDNHAYLLSYWCLAFAISAWQGNREILFRNARYLIAFTFGFATLKKWSSPEFINGSFFLVTFFLDKRFEEFVVLFSSVTFEQIDVARIAAGSFAPFTESENRSFVRDGDGRNSVGVVAVRAADEDRFAERLGA